MNYKDILDIIFLLRSNVILLLGWSLTLDVALIGWLIHQRGLHGIKAKIIATFSYTIFVIQIANGMYGIYQKLDLATNELYEYNLKQKAKSNIYIASHNGIIQHYIRKSPEYCKTIQSDTICYSISRDFYSRLLGAIIGWVINMILFWYSPIWKKVRNLDDET